MGQTRKVVVVDMARAPLPLPFLGVVVEAFEGVESDELSLTEGCKVVVVQCDDDGWWTVHAGEKIGIFPESYVDPMTPIKLPCFARVLKSIPEMKINQNETVSVSAITAEGWRVEANSNIGFCTWDYLEIVDKPRQPQNQPQQPARGGGSPVR